MPRPSRDPAPLLPQVRPRGSGGNGGESLPLRLSVSRSGLGIELTRPLEAGAFSVVELELALPGVAFPIDLSKGVKQFRSRRGELRRLKVELDLQRLEQRVLAGAGEQLGEPLLGAKVRATVPGAESERTLGHALANGKTVAESGLGRDAASLSVCLFGPAVGLCFDLVFCGGTAPLFIIDAVRGLGLSAPPLGLTLCLLERLFGEGGGDALRQGRAFALSGLVQRLCAEIFPPLGFRIPGVAKALLYSATAERGVFSVAVGSDGVERPGWARGLRLRGLSALTREADDALVKGDQPLARSQYLELLELAPGHPEILCALAEIDSYVPSRVQSALGLLGERRPGTADSSELMAPLVRLQALRSSLRPALYVEALREAAQSEPEGVLRALLLCELSERQDQLGASQRALDEAVKACPVHPRPRWARLRLALKRGNFAQAELDAQQLEALAVDLTERAATMAQLGAVFAEAGQGSVAVQCLLRALALQPEDSQLKLQLGRALGKMGRELEAAEVYQSALQGSGQSPGRQLGTETTEQYDEARLLLGRVLGDAGGDPRLGIAALREIASRSPLALQARVLEAGLARRACDVGARRNAWLRLLEAVEVGWIGGPELRPLLRRIELEERALGQDDVADFALRLLSRWEGEQGGVGVPSAGM